MPVLLKDGETLERRLFIKRVVRRKQQQATSLFEDKGVNVKAKMLGLFVVRH